MALDDDDVREILRLIDESDLAELRIETEGLSLHVLRGRGPAATGSDRGLTPAETSNTVLQGTDGPHEPASGDGVAIVSPMLGTFYRAPAPGAPPFVDVGARVETDTIVCIIEVMKMMNSVPAGVAGTIAEIHVENAQLVEYGQPLFRVEPA
jgi:acetyl-CoA carboxylase biotin carboxyl carrier protein